MADRVRNPWWIPPVLGRVPVGVKGPQLKLLGAVALALLFEEYDLAMLTSSLERIARDLGAAESQLGTLTGLIRFGALPAFLVVPLADRYGRRPIFIGSVVAMALTTCATAFSVTMAMFVALQMLTRVFFVAGSSVAFVMVTEEFPAEHRGWGIGVLGALAAVGHGLAAGVFAAIDVLPYGWRALYFFGIVPVLLLPLFLSRVQETERFRKLEGESVRGLRASFAPLVALWRRHPGRAVGVALTGLVPGFGIVTAFQFTGYYTLRTLQWEPGSYSLMVIVGGALGIGGHVVAGRLGDRIGRRKLGFGLLASFPVFVALFYLGPPAWVPFVWIPFVFSSQGGRTILRALATELFPTEQRAAAAGMYMVLDVMGSGTGLVTLSWAMQSGGIDLTQSVSLIAVAVALGGAVTLFFPDTHARDLEEIG